MLPNSISLLIKSCQLLFLCYYKEFIWFFFFFFKNKKYWDFIYVKKNNSKSWNQMFSVKFVLHAHLWGIQMAPPRLNWHFLVNLVNKNIINDRERKYHWFSHAKMFNEMHNNFSFRCPNVASNERKALRMFHVLSLSWFFRRAIFWMIDGQSEIIHHWKPCKAVIWQSESQVK